MKRCEWCLGNEMYIKYHDEEWGKPVYDDQVLFEFLVLESMQSGLSWLTILRKREHFKEAYDHFNPTIVAQYDEIKIDQLLDNKGIIRHRKKIESSINNAKRFLEIQKEFGSFNRYLWRFVEGIPIVNHYKQISEIPTTSPLSDLVSKELKKRGFQFLGSVTIYSYLQAIGIINDHIDSCFRKELTK